ncbi:hypothetical protein IW147_005097 [Coemansia sp. RSA 720]|nr:hypothetical protein IW147_005097 [Coemansia sp. RSA 720]
MELSGQALATSGSKTRQVTVQLRPGACTIIDWMARTAEDEADDQADALSQSDSDSSDDGGYTSNAGQVPPAIANDPFFAQILRNAELREASEKKKKKKVSRSKRRANDAEDDTYDLEDPFIDDSELTVMDGHNLAAQTQRKKRRKRDDGSNTETEGAGEKVADGDNAMQGDTEDAAMPSVDDLDKYDEDDFFVYHGPLNELAETTSDNEAFAAPTKNSRSRKRPEKKQPAKLPASSKKKANGTAAAKGETSDAGTKKKPDAKAQNRQTSSDSASGGPQVPSNGRKPGPRTSRKLDQGRSTSTIIASGDDKAKRPPIPDRDKAANGAVSGSKKTEAASSDAAPSGSSTTGNAKPPARRAGVHVSGAAVSSMFVTPDDSKALAEARMPTPEIETALAELAQATNNEAFTNRQRFPSSLKPALRQVCELSMARALEYDRETLALATPEHKIFAWTTPLDIVGFTTDIYHRLSVTLPYNRATVRKIVSKLLGNDLLTWKEQQLKQIEDGLKTRIDEQIERSMGWIPVAARTAKESEDAAAGGSQVRWHWTTLSKHVLYQYMVLVLNINELKNTMEQGPGKDGGYREQQARKDAYAHLVNLWPGSSMSTYEISRAYSSRKSLLEKQSKRADGGPVQTSGDRQPSTVSAAESSPAAIADAGSGHARTPELVSAANARPVTEVQSAHETLLTADSVQHSSIIAARQPMSPYMQTDHVSSPYRGKHQSPHFEYSNSPSSRFGEEPRSHVSPQSMLYDSSAGQFPSPSANSHRNLGFAAGLAVDQQLCAHGLQYDSSQPEHGHQPEHDHMHEPPQPTTDDEYNSRYNSMSVQNLTSP